MDCKEIEKMIPAFLEDGLDTEDLHDFIAHIEKCRECKEELSIQFLVSEGMIRLETGNVFDLQNELAARIENAEHTLKVRENMKWLLYMLEGLVAVLLITLIAMLILL
ncbi:MAG: zf-HC2 domain-containing protein [Lachnospiraceae bacterium]|nr:zf-HC2 domain-containing protein [Lachnospiraceae bacterium]